MIGNRADVLSWVLCVMLVGLVGCQETKTVSDEVREVTGLSSCTVKEDGYYYVAFLADVTGGLAAVGTDSLQGGLTAASDINEGGGINGLKLGVIHCNTQSDVAVAKTQLVELAGASPISAVVGGSAPEIIGLTPEILALHKPLVATFAIRTVISTIVDDGYIFRTQCIVPDFARAMAAEIAARGATRVAILPTGDTAHVEIGTTLTALLPSATYTVATYVLPKTFEAVTASSPVETTIKDAVNNTAAFAPNVIVAIGYGDVLATTIKLVEEKAALVSTPWIHFSGAMNDQTVQKVNDNNLLVGMRSHFQGGDLAIRQAVGARYEAMWNEASSGYANTGYDGMFISAMGMALATDPESGAAVRDALAKTHAGTVVPAGDWAAVLEHLADTEMNYSGMSGPVDFDANGDVPATFYQVEFNSSGKVVATGKCLAGTGSFVDCE